MISAKLQALVDCVCTEIVATGGGPVCWCGVWPGANVSLEFCTSCSTGCGMAWVSVDTVFPYNVYPASADVTGTCASPLAAQVSVGAVRCMPVAEDDGTLPSPDVLAATNDLVLADMLAIRKALACCGLEDIRLGPWMPIGPDGGCVGGQWIAYVEVD